MVDGKIYVYDSSETRHVIRNEIELAKIMSACHIDTDISDDESTPEKQPVADVVVMGNGSKIYLDRFVLSKPLTTKIIIRYYSSQISV